MSRLIELIKEVLLKHGRLARYRKILSVMMAVVVFTTTYALILPAITLDAESATEDPAVYLEDAVEASEGEEEALSEAELAAEEMAEEPSSDDVEEEESEAPYEENDPETEPEESAVEEIVPEEISAEEPSAELTTLTFKGEDYTVTASFDDDAHFPEGTELVVSEIRSDVKDKEEAEAYLDELSCIELDKENLDKVAGGYNICENYGQACPGYINVG